MRPDHNKLTFESIRWEMTWSFYGETFEITVERYDDHLGWTPIAQYAWKTGQDAGAALEESLSTLDDYVLAILKAHGALLELPFP